MELVWGFGEKHACFYTSEYIKITRDKIKTNQMDLKRRSGQKMQIILYFICKVKKRKACIREINKNVGLNVSEQVSTKRKTLVNTNGCTVPSLEMRRISCRLQLSLLPETIFTLHGGKSAALCKYPFHLC